MKRKIILIGASVFLGSFLCTTAIFVVPAHLTEAETEAEISEVLPTHNIVEVRKLDPTLLTALEEYCQQYDVDPQLVLSIIRQESRFRHDAVSERGARGLMQIMPLTQNEIMRLLELEESDDPKDNLRAGIFYLSKLQEMFRDLSAENRVRFVLAAYNAGPSRIYDAQEIAAYLGYDPKLWSSIRSCLPLLSKRHATLHQAIWPEGQPKNGVYGRWRQTVEYVEAVVGNGQDNLGSR